MSAVELPASDSVHLRPRTIASLAVLLQSKRWTSITMTDIAKKVGVSRGTLYNEFQTKRGVSEAYALWLTDTIVKSITNSIYANPGNAIPALTESFAEFFRYTEADPLVTALRAEEGPMIYCGW